MASQNSNPRLARLADAISYTAFSRSAIYRAINAGELQALKIGGALRFEFAELDRWINEKAQPIHLNK